MLEGTSRSGEKG